ncbi:hypothetical protein evm_006508 [Chilo suppressalis]|nr:hypothetical protein evm_006508 [Chilo suppressalis]
MFAKIICCVLFFYHINSVRSYEVPPAKLEALHPKGLRVSIPDDGYSLFAFHGKLNEEMNGLEAGQWSKDITRAKGDRWTFLDRNAVLKLGDKIYFWTYVIRDGLGYRQDNSEWTVTGFVDESGSPVDSSTDSTTPASVPVDLMSPTPMPFAPKPPSPEDVVPISLSTISAAPPNGADDNSKYPCEISVSKVSVPGFVCKGQLLFEDNFNSNLEKGKVWTTEIMFPGEPDFPFNVYLNDRNLRVRNGMLKIRPVTLESKYGEDYVTQSLDLTSRCTGAVGTDQCARESFGPQILPPIITAKVTTRNRFNFMYGRVEVRAKMPVGDWLVPLIQLEPHDHTYGVRNYASGVLRVACAKGNAEYYKKLQGGPIMCDTEPYRSTHLKEKIGYEQWANHFHIYSLEWRPDGISLSVDGEKYGEVNPGSGFSEDAKKLNVTAASQWLKGTIMAPFDQMFYISIGLNVGGLHEFPDSTTKPWKDRATKAMLNFWTAKEQWFPTWSMRCNCDKDDDVCGLL